MALYILFLGLAILLIQLVDNDKIQHKKLIQYREYYPLAIQFFFGSLFSAYVVFYFQSASLSKNWLFMLFLIIMLIGNEFVKDYLSSLRLNLALYFVAVFSFFTFFIPVLVRTMNTLIFLLSGFFSLAVLFTLIHYLKKIETEKNKQIYKSISIMLIITFVFLNLLYFLNWIPPVPLSLKEGGIYHHIHKSGERYELRFEKDSWFKFWQTSDATFNFNEGDTVFCFASVFAPTKLDKKIFHHWQYYDLKQKKWVTTDRRSYYIMGGRDGGYRGYTFKKNIQPGKWRVDVETDEYALLGRIPFSLETSKQSSLLPEFKTIFR